MCGLLEREVLVLHLRLKYLHLDVITKWNKSTLTYLWDQELTEWGSILKRLPWYNSSITKCFSLFMQTTVHKMVLPRLAVCFLSRKITNLVLPKCVFSQASSRGIKNAYSVEQKKKKQEEIEKRTAASRPGGEGGLRVSLKKKQYD